MVVSRVTTCPDLLVGNYRRLSYCGNTHPIFDRIVMGAAAGTILIEDLVVEVNCDEKKLNVPLQGNGIIWYKGSGRFSNDTVFIELHTEDNSEDEIYDCPITIVRD